MILIALGANLPSRAGPPAATLRAAIRELQQGGVVPTKISRFFETVAWPDPADPPFVNAVVEVRTALAPGDLLSRLHRIEQSFGRERGEPNAPRTLDLDIIDYDGRVEAGPPRLPHPRIEQREFVLVPLRDIAPDWHHPVSHRSVGELIDVLSSCKTNIKPLPD